MGGCGIGRCGMGGCGIGGCGMDGCGVVVGLVRVWLSCSCNVSYVLGTPCLSLTGGHFSPSRGACLCCRT